MRPPAVRSRGRAWLLALLILVACGGGQPPQPYSATVDECVRALGAAPAPVTGVFVEPDDGYSPVLDELDDARCGIDLTIYMLTDDQVFEAFDRAVDRGVRVRVMLEQHPFGAFGDQQEAFDRLRSLGAAVQWGLSAHRFTHAKFAVIDARVALIMNQNLTHAAFNGNREYGVVTTEPDAVAQATTIFARDWSGISTADVKGPLVVSPENSRARVVALIAGATESIDLYAEVIADEGIVATLRDAEARGVAVRLIVNASFDDEEDAALVTLAEAGIEVRLMDDLYIHSKTLIVDGDTALIGSQNYTATSLDRNRELGIVVDDPALVARCVAVYERDWLRAIPASPIGVPAGLGDLRLAG
jgi:phosphatidylserine/phosphatidylglycerophosphate/cardiolipin synthase-like enzyme